MKKRNNYFFVLVAGLTLGVWACAGTTPRVLEVSTTTRTRDIPPGDEQFFAHDRASHFNYTPKVLPTSEQREEFFVRWRPATVDLVKFEYHQLNSPTQNVTQTFAPQNRTWNMFAVRGNDFVDGGPVTAWRVTLWAGGQLLAEQQSPLW
ncbi:MAG: hypothetical protein ABSC38_02230 [Verrucomicrobiia bacterium]